MRIYNEGATDDEIVALLPKYVARIAEYEEANPGQIDDGFYEALEELGVG